MQRITPPRRRGASGSEYGMGVGVVATAALVALLQAGGSIDSLLTAAVNEIAETTNTVAEGGDGETSTPPINTSPVFERDTAALTIDEDENADIAALLSARDPDSGQTLNWRLAGAPTHGTISGLPASTAAGMPATPPGVTYHPDVDFNGTDAFTVEVDDNANGRDTLSVAVTITPENDAPAFTASAPSVTVGEDGSADISSTLEAADADDGDTLTWNLMTTPSHGTVSGLTATATATNGGTQPTGITYTPDPDFAGSDSFDVSIADGNGQSSIVTVTVDVPQTNDAPMFVDDGNTLTVPVGQTTDIADLLAVEDPDPGETVTWTVVSGPYRGTVQNVDGASVTAPSGTTRLSPEGATYTPQDIGSTDSLMIKVTDASGDTDTMTLSLTAEYVIGTKITGDAVYVGEHTWGNYGQDTAVNSYNGRYNTNLLVSRGGHPAANACANLEYNGHTDWYLPSATELGALPKIPGTHENDAGNMFSSSSEAPPQTENRQEEFAAFALVPGFNPRYTGWFSGKSKDPNHVLCIR